MPERFDEALDVTGAAIGSHGNPADRALHRHAAAMRETVASWCGQLTASRASPSLDHNDLHPWNILGDGPRNARFYDWGDSVVAHPFAAMLVPLGFVKRHLDVSLDDPRFMSAREAYLRVFTALAPEETLATTLEVACRVGKVARIPRSTAHAAAAERSVGERPSPAPRHRRPGAPRVRRGKPQGWLRRRRRGGQCSHPCSRCCCSFWPGDVCWRRRSCWSSVQR
ncbi:phosphotransferase [Pseudonocardia sp. H11422]|uniref:phosphotransferase n=1 Tax=Pseudonocardia sp. H11422 TaxID=2835866 RepID=UPI003977371E